MLAESQVKIGNCFLGLINNVILEITDIKKELDNRWYVVIIDLKTKKTYQKEKEYFKKLLLKQVEND